VRKTSQRLADDREIIYYDSAAVGLRQAKDSRDIGSVTVSSELRRDPLLGMWVMYASHRQDRTYLPAARDCPLCPSTDDHLTEVPEHDYEVVVFENRFPALKAPAPETVRAETVRAETVRAETVRAEQPIGALVDCTGASLLAERAGAGRCEVVCYTADHNAAFHELTPSRIDLVLEALIDRTRELGAREDVEQVFCFENRGQEIGVTQPHPHGQIYAYPFITPVTERVLSTVAAYRQNCGRNLFDDVLDAERADGSRTVLATDHWTAFVPHAARWPYELHCYPNDRVPDLPALSGPARSELPEVLHDIFGRFAGLFDKPAPYIAGWHQAPARTGREDFALHLELFTLRRANDKLKFLAGSESGMGAFANDIVPEAAAARLRALAV
jgi:UDPglucose--hexose-1-phosphate uridylyltransferase